MISKIFNKKIALSLLIASFLTASGPALSGVAAADAAKQESAAAQSLFEWAKRDPGLQKAAKQGITMVPNQKVTKDGVTLKLTDYLFDGARVSFALQREGDDFETTLDDITNAEKKGVLLYVDIYIDGKKMDLQSYGRSELQDNSLLISFNDLSVKGPRTLYLPKQFELTVKAHTSGVKDPFTFKLPVKKQAPQNTVLSKAVVKKAGNFSYTVKRVELTPYSSRLELAAQGAHKQVKDLKNLGFDLADSKGNTLSPILQANDGVVKKQRYFDMTYTSFAAVPSSIVVKPYTFKTDSKGKLVQNSDGSPIKVYLEDLELNLPLNK
ncbi:DUF5643 domain-containing protein [Paenibacillus macerans]|uniref:DUF5643 domain-containing protein n=1 Tax=Paenibacillus macerans TaxID=44252 RepID=UPI002DBC3F42|nr:DUF5643 domain-containing protein [Paenibacillus macerans]MEC0328310.1 DUF5643 domain-containing protein [Paenibacillus macerans]